MPETGFTGKGHAIKDCVIPGKIDVVTGERELFSESMRDRAEGVKEEGGGETRARRIALNNELLPEFMPPIR